MHLVQFRSFLCPWDRKFGVQFIIGHSLGKLSFLFVIFTSSKAVKLGIILIFIAEESIFKIFVDL